MYRISGLADHLANDDQHALQMCRDIVANLNPDNTASSSNLESSNNNEYEEPIYDPEELYGIVPSDIRQPFDIRAVSSIFVDIII